MTALDALLYQRLIRPEKLEEIAYARGGWPGVGRFRRAARLARPHVESPMETRMRLLLVDAGLPEPTVQYTVVDGGLPPPTCSGFRRLIVQVRTALKVATNVRLAT